MNGTRRFSITKEQGELIALALTALIEDLYEIMRKDSDPYWKLLRERAALLQKSIKDYNWYK